MACDDVTPWTLTNHPYPVYRQRISGGATDQDTGEWIPETTASIQICGSIGRGLGKGIAKGSASTKYAELERLAGAEFRTGDMYLICHSDCDVDLNDIIEVYQDAAGVTKSYWRVLMQLKSLATMTNLNGYGQNYWLLRSEKR